MTFAELHDAAGTLFSEVLQIDPSIRRVLFRRPLVEFQKRLDALSNQFIELDGQFARGAPAPSDFNTALLASANYGSAARVRDSVRGLLTDTSSTLASLRNRLDFLGSLVLALASLAVAMTTLIVTIISARTPNAITATPPSPTLAPVTQRSQAGEQDWLIVSFDDKGVLTARHQNNIYTAKCVESTRSNGQADDPNRMQTSPSCDLPFELVGRTVQPFDGVRRDAQGRLIVMFESGHDLAIRSTIDEHHPWALDLFTIISVAASR
jgi:hypothetical protein